MGKMRRTIEPHDVFTPAAALRQDMFATREGQLLERELMDALNEPGRHVAIHGWTGVGKTSLVEYVCERNDIRYLPVECAGSVDSLLEAALSVLDATERASVVKVKRSGVEGGAHLAVLSGKAESDEAVEEEFRDYSSSREIQLADALAAAEVSILFIDNLEDLDQTVSSRRQLCRLLKLFSARTREMGPRAPRVIVAGPTPDIREFMMTDNAVARRTRQIEVPRMRTTELEQILSKGEIRLGMAFDAECRDLIVTNADGFPYYAHLYALHSARVARREGRTVITADDFGHALASILDSCSATLREEYGRATRARGDPALRRGALAAVASLPAVEIASQEVRCAFVAAHPEYERVERVRFLGRILNELRDESGILEEAWLDDGTPAVRFRDPLMRVYVRLRELSEERARDLAWRASLPETR